MVSIRPMRPDDADAVRTLDALAFTLYMRRTGHSEALAGGGSPGGGARPAADGHAGVYGGLASHALPVRRGTPGAAPLGAHGGKGALSLPRRHRSEPVDDVGA